MASVSANLSMRMARRVGREARPAGVVSREARTEARLEPPAGKEVDRRAFRRQQGRIPPAGGEYERTEADGLCGSGRGGERRQGRDRIHQTVRHEDGPVAQGFRATHLREPCLARSRLRRDEAETERSLCHHPLSSEYESASEMNQNHQDSKSTKGTKIGYAFDILGVSVFLAS